MLKRYYKVGLGLGLMALAAGAAQAQTSLLPTQGTTGVNSIWGTGVTDSTGVAVNGTFYTTGGGTVPAGTTANQTTPQDVQNNIKATAMSGAEMWPLPDF